MYMNLNILPTSRTRFPGSSSFMSGDALEWQQEMTVDNNIDGSQMTANITLLEANSTLWNIGIPKSTSSRAPDKLTPLPVPDKLTPLQVLYKKDFQKMPNWTTNDVYLQSNEPIQRSCAESLHKIKDPDIQKAFMPSIQMYLYQNLLNQSEWNRLAHFNNPFGFMEYNYSDIKKVVDLIPKPRSTQLLPLPENNTCSRCAVVANGGILYGSKMGQEIDAHHYVFRTNGAVIKGHEEDVGNRTSVYVHTAFSLVTSLTVFKKYGFNKIPSDEGIKYVMIPEGLRDFLWLQGLLTRQEVTNGQFQKKQPWTYYEGFDESRFYVLHPDFLRYIRNRFMTSKQQDGKHWAMYRPTNGAFTLFLALHVCDTVDAYGFITENHRNYSNYYFEKNQKTKVIFYINHDYNLEIKTWQKLHNAKIIRLYQHDGRQT
ncbi:alpha-N-acetylgalactosaminide alpha-2,6-sialyltransferase 1-like [Electrophorus electricus]|uniref:alpha-N-acetylgalactosaminide alpha-2,6-sialyltransferase 1-like n=1 Tax=Electrophorus electricus TaxID=8005 RepID=UPI0015D02E7E|nr:alpha-N-acetylgalactosaminide alpha-2,6-sialyltransferase 1-like [Electrophorus electricus]